MFAIWLISGFNYLKLKLNWLRLLLWTDQRVKIKTVSIGSYWANCCIHYDESTAYSVEIICTFLHFISSTNRYIIWGFNWAEALFISACLWQIVLKCIPSTYRPLRKTLESIFKRNYILALRIEFIKSPFCCVQYVPRMFIRISLFELVWGWRICLLKRD